MARGDTPEADLLGWLERLEVPISETEDIQRFQKFLEDEIAVTPKRLDQLWSAVEMKYDVLGERGARPILVKFPAGDQLRFGVQGFRGLYGFEKMSELIGL